MSDYLVIIFGQVAGHEDPRHWTRFYEERADAMSAMDKAIAAGLEVEVYKRFRTEYRRIY